MGAKVLLNVQVRKLLTLGDLEELSERGVILNHNDPAILGVLELVLLDVHVNTTGNSRSRKLLIQGDPEELSKLGGNRLFPIETVVLRTLSCLGAIGVIKARVNLADLLVNVLQVFLVREKEGRKLYQVLPFCVWVLLYTVPMALSP